MGSNPSIAIIGAGFAGLGQGYYLKKAGIDSFTIYEKAADLGGVWRDNTYPGAACDVPSHLYSFSFEPHYPWSRAYGPQSDILDYLHRVARKYELMRHIRFGREVAGAEFHEARGLWKLRFSGGETAEAQVLISGVGQLHRPAFPEIPDAKASKVAPSIRRVGNTTTISPARSWRASAPARARSSTCPNSPSA